MSVATNLDVIPGDLADAFGEQVSEDDSQELVELTFGIEEALSQTGEDPESSEGGHDP